MSQNHHYHIMHVNNGGGLKWHPAVFSVLPLLYDNVKCKIKAMECSSARFSSSMHPVLTPPPCLGICKRLQSLRVTTGPLNRKNKANKQSHGSAMQLSTVKFRKLIYMQKMPSHQFWCTKQQRLCFFYIHNCIKYW